MTTITIVSLQQAKDHLQMDHDLSDADIQLKIDQASDIVINFLKIPEDKWTEGTAFGSPQAGVPPTVQAATLLVLGELFAKREAAGADVLSETVKSLLRRHRHPAMA